MVVASGSVLKSLPDLSKLEPLDGINYKRWSQKPLIFFERLEVDYVLFTLVPDNDLVVLATPTVTPSTEKTRKDDEESKAKYVKDNKVVRGHLLNHVTNALFDIFVEQKYAKEIWDNLESRYGVDDVGRKKYVVGKWMEF